MIIKNKDTKIRLQQAAIRLLSLLMVTLIIVIINLFSQKINVKIDLTRNNLFTISPKTIDILQQLEQPIDIYVLEEVGKETQLVKEILDTYKKKTKQLTITYVDPILNPMFASQYVKENETVSMGSIIVSKDERYDVIQVYDLYDMRYDNNKAVSLEAYAIEDQITNAIIRVTSEALPTIRVITGHQESALPSALSDGLTKNGYSVTSGTLLDEAYDPQKDLLVFVAPQKDFMEEELRRMHQFMDDGGSTLFLMEFTSKDQPNIEKLLRRFGIELIRGIVFDPDKTYMYPGRPNFLMPKIEESQLTKGIIQEQVPVMLPLCLGIKESSIIPQHITLIPLLTTSKDSYVKQNLTSKVFEKETGDITGSVYLAMSSQEDFYTRNGKTTSRLTVIGSSYLLDSSLVPLDAVANVPFLLQNIHWMSHQAERHYIQHKQPEKYTLILTEKEVMLYAILFIIVIPLFVVGIGIKIWLRRRYL
ncbi:GldG family protein [Vallitalea pronyensis]|uniref:GldG family protein n=1 Tax=Vallitalea pronyensis TaxID=1348613 RepID=A0A8J8SI24_9FIRM|nr:GldG family protein [Vallitalea pronyensis]QUI24043.1 GldG family protein [Vallitalea pronyensis]